MSKKIKVYTFPELGDEVKEKKAEKAIVDGLFLDNYYAFDVPYVKEQGEEHAEKSGFFTVDSDGIFYKQNQDTWLITGSFDLNKMHAFFLEHNFTEDEYNFLLDNITYVDVVPYYSDYDISYNLALDMSPELESRFERALNTWLEKQIAYINTLDKSMRATYEDVEWTIDALENIYAYHYFTADGIDVGMLDE